MGAGLSNSLRAGLRGGSRPEQLAKVRVEGWAGLSNSLRSGVRGGSRPEQLAELGTGH